MMKLMKNLIIPDEVKQRTAEIVERAQMPFNYKIVFVASLYIAYREKGYPISLNELASFYKVDKVLVQKIIRAILKRLNIKLPLINIEELLLKYAEELKLTKEDIEIAKTVLRKIYKQGRNPTVSIAAAIYYLGKFKKIELSQKFGVSEPSITANFRAKCDNCKNEFKLYKLYIFNNNLLCDECGKLLKV